LPLEFALVHNLPRSQFAPARDRNPGAFEQWSNFTYATKCEQNLDLQQLAPQRPRRIAHLAASLDSLIRASESVRKFTVAARLIGSEVKSFRRLGARAAAAVRLDQTNQRNC